MNKDKLVIFTLLFFVLVFLTSIYAFFSSRDDKPVKKILQSNYKPGIFSVRGESNANVSVPFDLQFITDSSGQTANAISLQVTFDPSALEVVKVDTTQSFCQFYPENRFNNVQGTLSLQCGSPHPGFKGENIIAKVTFMPKSITQTNIVITEKSMILVSDGKGTNIFTQPVTHVVTIQNNI